MKRIATTVGLLALGAASLHAIYAPELTRVETGKPWTVAASLRGFYDDNWAYAPDSAPGSKDSWGFEARPYIGFNFPMEQSYFGISYLNSSRFYEARSNSGMDAWDFSHQVDMRFDHQFSPRYRLKVDDSFLYSQQPDVQADVVSNPFRSDLSYYRNLGKITLNGELTRQLGFSLGYNNTFYNYTDSGVDSYAARLNRLEHRIPVDLRWQFQPDLVGLIGYQYGMFNYTDGGTISGGVPSSARDFQSHAIYVGGDYDITAQLRASLRVGAQYNSYDDYSDESNWTPYVDLSLNYFYTVGSHVDFGFKNTVAATDVADASLDTGMPVLSQEVSAIYLRLTHQFTPKLTGSLLVQYQWDNFHGGAYNDVSEGLLYLSLYANYQINQFLSVEAGYSYDNLSSDIRVEGVDNRSFNRNYVFLGLRAQY
jgi:hypothetical protein